MIRYQSWEVLSCWTPFWAASSPITDSRTTRRPGRAAGCWPGAKHWWLTAFSVGRFSNPEDLYMRAAISFPHCSMAEAFVEGLVNTGYCRHDISICHNTVTFSFTKSFMKYGCLRRLRIRLVQRINRFWCSVYLFVTRPFCLSLDKILYLYYYLPFVFRKILRVKKYKKRKIKRR